jgi:hypothetical protein
MRLTGDVGWLAGLLGCGTGNLPLKYLGLPLGASFKLKTMWAGFGGFEVSKVGRVETSISIQGR